MRYYQGGPELQLLCLDPACLDPEKLKMENGFPHYYDSLPPSAVRWTRSLPRLRDLKVVLLSQISPSLDCLTGLAERGADLVVLPELPFQPWYPAQRKSSELVVSEPCSRQAELAAQAGLAVLGGGLSGGQNVACLWDSKGQRQLSYAKMHRPQEPGFWECDYFEPGQYPPKVCDALGFPLGVQLCSDIQRPFGASFLQAQGCGAILLPRATEVGTYEHWKLVIRATARMHATYVATVNRPQPEGGVPLGGPSLLVDPHGRVVAEGTEDELWCDLKVSQVVEARAGYPGYLESPLQVYADSWGKLAGG